MNKNRIISLILGICGEIIGLIIIIVSIVDIAIPKLLWLVFAIFCMINSILILRNTKQN